MFLADKMSMVPEALKLNYADTRGLNKDKNTIYLHQISRKTDP